MWIGQLVSGLGTAFTAVAVPYQVYRLTRSSLAVGLLSLVQFVPLLLGALTGGSAADALDRRRVLLAAQLAMAACSAGLALNATGGHPALWPLFVASGISAAFGGADMTIRAAVIGNLVDADSLVAANALRVVLMGVALVGGPALGGLLLAHAGAGAVYWIDVATFGVSLATVFGLPSLQPEGGGTRAGLGSIIEGLRYLRGRQVLQGIFVIDLDAMIFGMPRALFPAMGISVFHGGATAVGYLYAAPGAGALLGSLSTGWASRVRHHGRAVLIAVSVWGLAIVAFGLTRLFPAAIGCLTVAGAADVVSAVFRGTMLQLESPDRLRGRLFAIQTAVVTGGPRLGDAEAGLVASLAGLQASIISGGLACVAGALVIARLMPAFAKYQGPPQARAAGPGPEA